MKKLSSAFALLLSPVLAMAQGQVTDASQILARHGEGSATEQQIMLAILLLLTLVLTIVTLSLFSLSARLRRMQTGVQKAVQQTAERVTWMHLFSKKGHTPDQLMEGHDIDGISEYDNNPPAWFNWLFYGSIAFAVVYMLYFHVFGMGKLQLDEYADQMKQAEVQLARAQEKAIQFAEMPPFHEPEKLEMGKATYASSCAMCHGDAGQGNIGPNLTDNYWIHGGRYSEIFKTIYNGVPEKGMLSWKKSLRPEQIRAVASYIETIKGTNAKGANPVSPKGPEGNLVQ